MKKDRSSFWMFLVGLGSITQFRFIGSLGLSELPIFLLAPFFFIKDYRQLKYDGFLPFIWLAILTCVGCVVSSYINRTPFIWFLKGLAHPYAIFASTVIMHRLMRGNFKSLRYYMIGTFISGIISIFIFQQETYIVKGSYVAEGADATALVISNPLFWSMKIKELLMLPVNAFYLSTPIFYSVFSGIIVTIVTLFFSESSGRSAALVMLVSVILISLGKKSRTSIRKLGKHILLIGVCGIIALWAFKGVYSWAAKSGHLGYRAQDKYMHQTRAGDSALKILMAGRMEFFCGVLACFDRPIWGFGPRGEDTEGYVENYLNKYGTREDFESFIRNINYKRMRDGDVYIAIPAHSHIASFWVNYGFFGLFLWLYVLWLIFINLKKYAYAVPQWYGFICLTSSLCIWDIFFSPFAGRILIPTLVSCILFSKAIAKKRLCLPIEMENEARQCD